MFWIISRGYNIPGLNNNKSYVVCIIKTNTYEIHIQTANENEMCKNIRQGKDFIFGWDWQTINANNET